MGLNASPVRRPRGRLFTVLREPLLYWVGALAALVVGLPALKPLFAAGFPALERPMYEHESFVALLWAHAQIVAVSSAVAIVVSVAAAVGVTRRAGLAFRPPVETLVAISQTVPPVAVLALCVPLIGFGETPALIALALYGVLPVLRGTLAGLDAVPVAVRDAALGIGLSARQVLWHAELPLALPALLAGVRTSVVVNIGTAAIASTVGARTLGSPLVIGLSGFNTAYVIQGAAVVALLAVVVDRAFERWGTHLERWRAAGTESPENQAHTDPAELP